MTQPALITAKSSVTTEILSPPLETKLLEVEQRQNLSQTSEHMVVTVPKAAVQSIVMSASADDSSVSKQIKTVALSEVPVVKALVSESSLSMAAVSAEVSQTKQIHASMSAQQHELVEMAEQLRAQRLESQQLEARLQAQRDELRRLEQRKLEVGGVFLESNLTDEQKFIKQREKAEEQRLKMETQLQQKAVQQLEIRRLQEKLSELELKQQEAHRLEGGAVSANEQQSMPQNDVPYLYSDELISGIADWAVKLHQLGGMERLVADSRSCYEQSGESLYRCVYFDLAARKIGSISAASFNSKIFSYFSDADFAYRLTSVFQQQGLPSAAVNAFLRTESPRMNVFVVQKVNMSGFVN